MFDYQKYGAFKASSADGESVRLKRFARSLGLRNRYLRFLDGASHDAPLVEIGCGDGSFMRELSARGFHHVVGIEPSPSYISVVPPDAIVRAFAHEYFEQAPSASIGTAVAMDVFEHIPADQLKRLLVLIEDRLMPGGMLMLRVPNLATAMGLYNYHGDLSHTTAFTEVSLRQLAFETSFGSVELHAEPFAYPRTMTAAFGILLWAPYRWIARAVLAAFGINAGIVTPNVVCLMRKRGVAS